MTRKLAIGSGSFFILAVGLVSQMKRTEVGPVGDGGYRLNTGWLVKPAGRSISLGTLPLAHAVSADGKTAAVLNGGYMPPTVSLIDVASGKETQRVDVKDAWRGLAFAPDGKRIYVGGGSRGVLTVLAEQGGTWAEERIWRLAEGPTPNHLISDLLVTADGKRLLVADLFDSTVRVLNLEDGSQGILFETAPSPYSMTAHPDGKSVLVSSWSTASIHQYGLSDGKEISKAPTGAHPTEMIWRGGTLYVACANTNSVMALKQEGSVWKAVETLNLALTPKQPVGITPSALALSADGKTLYVVCSDANMVAVVDVSGARAAVRGFVPTGWYPTGVRVVAGGGLLILNGKGNGSHPNPNGLTPYKWPVETNPKAAEIEYVARIQTGSAQFVPAFDAAKLAEYTAQVRANSPYRDAVLDAAKPEALGGIKYCILLMKENRTYDQVLGDMKEGNGDPSLTLFGENITPNHHQLAREFGLLDNFYVNADVSSDGEYWTTAAISPDVNQKTWPMGYARRMKGAPRVNPEGIRTTPGGHIWDKALAAGLTIRNYGFTATNLPHREPDAASLDRVEIAGVKDPVLKPHTNFAFRQHDRAFPDVERMKVILREMAGWEKTGGMPRLIAITIGNDHTEGTRPGACTPASCVAENDQAFGTFVEGFSKTKFWGQSAIFVLEDDAQDGADHVDSHRSPAYVISPYTRGAGVQSGLYNTASVLRTIELILGLTPMTTFDAAAEPLTRLFSGKADLRPYTNLPARVSLTDKNAANTKTAARSLRLDFRESDAADARELNEILWIAMKGTEPPAPVRSLFADR